MKELFINWLKYNNCYEQYMFNFNNQKDWHKCNSFDEFIDKYSLYDYMGAFLWDNAKEGFNYWSELDDKWEYFCKNNIKTICKLEKP